MFDQPWIFVDLETTGANAVNDRITEIGMVEVEVDGNAVREWSTLVNPGVHIPAFIQGLTGISDEMVANAPLFADVAQEALSRMQGKLFIAHNARFDYGFLRNEFKRIGINFSSAVLCTVKLSRKIFPQYHKHSLDAIIERHNLPLKDRHRALADARSLWFFMQHITENQSNEQVAAAMALLAQRPALPSDMDPSIIDDLPETYGVYTFYGIDGQPLYIGKSSNIRKKVLSHFASETRLSKEGSLEQQTKRIEWIETVSELGALLTESQLIKTLQPVHNRRQRQSNELCTWQLVEESNGVMKPYLRYAKTCDFGSMDNIYGLFQAKKSAINTLHKLADAYQLCYSTLGLEAALPGSPCAAYRARKCLGVCNGDEPVASYNLRLRDALSKSRVQPWPFNGIAGIKESASFGNRTEIHLVKNWGYLGTVSSENAFFEKAGEQSQEVFDLDIYKILSKHMHSEKLQILQINNAKV